MRKNMQKTGNRQRGGLRKKGTKKQGPVVLATRVSLDGGTEAETGKEARSGQKAYVLLWADVKEGADMLHNAACCLAIPERNAGRCVRLLKDLFQSLWQIVCCNEFVGAKGNGDRTFRILAQGETGNAKVTCLFLHTARVGEYGQASLDKTHEGTVGLWCQQAKVRCLVLKKGQQTELCQSGPGAWVQGQYQGDCS